MDALDPQLAKSRAISGQPIKLILQIVEASIPFPSDIFNERIKSGGEGCDHLSFALPTFKASKSIKRLIFLMIPSSFGVGVRAAIAEAAAITAVIA